MIDTLEIECLMQAISEYDEARQEERQACTNYDGYSWGYHGASFIQAREKAAEDVQNRLNKIIDERIEERLKTFVSYRDQPND